MTRQLNIGGRLRPVKFGFAALYEYEVRTGRNAIQDFAGVATAMPSVTFIVDLLICGLNTGALAQRSGDRYDDAHEVAAWLDDNPALISEVMDAFAESFPKEADATEKKRTGIRGKA